jgi:hypothetical protein
MASVGWEGGERLHHAGYEGKKRFKLVAYLLTVYCIIVVFRIRSYRLLLDFSDPLQFGTDSDSFPFSVPISFRIDNTKFVFSKKVLAEP